MVRRGLFHAQHSTALNTVMNDAATGSSHAEKWKYLLKEQAYTSFEGSNEPEGGVSVAKGHMIWMLIAIRRLQMYVRLYTNGAHIRCIQTHHLS